MKKMLTRFARDTSSLLRRSGYLLASLAILFLLSSWVWAADYYVDPVNGNNLTGTGSIGDPWSTITYTLTQVTTGDTIHAAAGTYDTNPNPNDASIEAFPLNMKDGVNLEGASRETTVVSADATARVMNCNNITSPTTITKLTITNGLTSDPGGGIYVNNSSANLVINNCIVSYNKSTSFDEDSGGGIVSQNSSPWIQFCLITSNESDQHGGGVGVNWPTADPARIYNCEISYNTAVGGWGGGVNVNQGGNLNISSSNIHHNISGYVGGGVAVINSNSIATLEGCELSNNSGNFAGGGAACGGDLSRIDLFRCLIKDNQATNPGGVGGGGEFDRSASLTNCLIIGNRLADPGEGGSAICTGSDDPTVTVALNNCTIVDNISNNEKGAVYLRSPWPGWSKNNLLIKNTTIANNSSTYEIYAVDYGSMNVTYSDVYHGGAGNYVYNKGSDGDISSFAGWGWDGTGCISNDPKFVGSGDYHEKSMAGHWTPSGWVLDSENSPAIDKGDPADPYFDEPAPNGSRINMGAYGGTEQASKSPPILMTAYCTPETFSPEWDTVADWTGFYLTASHEAGIASWEVRIYKDPGYTQLVNSQLAGVGDPPSGPQPWYGYDDLGIQYPSVPDGTYYWVYKVWNNLGTAAELNGTVGVDAKPMVSGHDSATSLNNSRRIVRDSSGNLHLVYSSEDHYGTNGNHLCEIYYCKLSPAGQVLAGPINLSNSVGKRSTLPSIVITAANKLFAIWQETWHVSGPWDTIQYDKIYWSKSDDGITWTTPEQVPTTGVFTYNPSLAVDSNNIFHLVYDTMQDIWHTQTAGDGIWLDPENISNMGPNYCAYPAIAVDNQDYLHVVWRKDEGIGPIYTYNLYYTSKEAGGWTLPVNITSTLGNASEYPSLTIDSLNRLHLVWERHQGFSPNPPENFRIYYSSAESGSWSEPLALTETDTFRPSVSVDNQNNPHIIWYDVTGEIYYREYTRSGWSAPENLSKSPTKASTNPNLRLKAPGILDLVWTEEKGSAPYDIKYLGLDVGPPTVVSTDPQNNATGVAVNTQVRVTFSELMDQASAQDAFVMTIGGMPPGISGTFSWILPPPVDGVFPIMVFTPSANMKDSTTYQVDISTTAKDQAGNPMTDPYTFSFTTGALPPVISDVKIDGRAYLSGDIISATPRIEARITDEDGVKKVEILVNDVSKFLVEPSGTPTEYNLSTAITPALPEGTYGIKIKAWDTRNNESLVSMPNLKVEAPPVKLITPPVAYPTSFSPTRGQTTTLSYTLNVDAEITIYLYDITGRLIWKKTYPAGAPGGQAGYNEMLWNGLTDFGEIAPNGMYIFKVIYQNQVLASGKVVITD